MAAATAAIIGAVALSAAATAYQADQAKKQRKAAEANAQAQYDDSVALQEDLKNQQAANKENQAKAFANKAPKPSTPKLPSTILTSPLGVSGPASTAGKKLLGE